MAYASGKKSKAICDICGFECNYTELRDYIYDQRPNGLRVCPTCFDEDNPQLLVGTMPVPEAIALYRGRPDSGDVIGGRGFAGFRPVIGNLILCNLNPPTVTIT